MDKIISQLNHQIEEAESNLQKAHKEINTFGTQKSKMETDMTFLKVW